MKKRILAALCAILVLFGSVSGTVFAGTNDIYGKIEIVQNTGFRVGERMDSVSFSIYDTSVSGVKTDITSEFDIEYTYYYGAFGMISLEEEFRRKADLIDRAEYDFGDGPESVRVYLFALSAAELEQYKYSENVFDYRYKAKIKLTPKSGHFAETLIADGAEIVSVDENTVELYADIIQSEDKITSMRLTASPKSDKVVTISAPALEDGYEYLYSFNKYITYEGEPIGVNKTPSSSKAFGAGKSSVDISISDYYEICVYKVAAGAAENVPQAFSAYGHISVYPKGLVWSTQGSELGNQYISGSGSDALLGVYTTVYPTAEYYSDADCTKPIRYYDAEAGSTVYVKLTFTNLSAFKDGEYSASDFGLVVDDAKYVPETVSAGNGTVMFTVPVVVPEKDSGKYKVTIDDVSGKFAVLDTGNEYEAGETVFIYVTSDPQYMIQSAYCTDYPIFIESGNYYIAISPMPAQDITVTIDAREGDYVVFTTEDGTVLQDKAYIGEGLELPSFTVGGKAVIGWKCDINGYKYEFSKGDTFTSFYEGSVVPNEHVLIAILGSSQCDHASLAWQVSDETDAAGNKVHYRKCPYCGFEESHSCHAYDKICTPSDSTHHTAKCCICGLTEAEACVFDKTYCEMIDKDTHSCGTICMCGNKKETGKEAHDIISKSVDANNPGIIVYVCSKCGVFTAEADEGDCEHTNVKIVNAVEAGCETDGYTGDKVCEDCGRTIETGSVIKAKGHTIVKSPEQLPTCVDDGHTYGEFCSECGKEYVSRAIIPATGIHTYGPDTFVTDKNDPDYGKYKHYCTVCGHGEIVEVLRGDVNGDGKVNSTDAIYLLRHTLRPSGYKLNQGGDMQGDGKVNSTDAIYLLRHTLRPGSYILAPDTIGAEN